MNFIFVCRDQNRVFESNDFSIVENKGVSDDGNGNKVLDAQVVLNQPCPYCGKKHVYRASELVCPFNG